MRRAPSAVAVCVVATLLLAVSCGGDAVVLTPVHFLSFKLGGLTTAKALRGRPYNQSARNLTNAELKRFGAGADVFDQTVDVAGGLGPKFNEASCLGCHLDGKQQPHEQTAPPGLLVRVSAAGTDEHGAPLPEPTYGLQFQTKAVAGAQVEATISPRFVPVTHRWDDGHLSTIFRLDVGLRPQLGPVVKGAETSVRMAPSIIGLGLLEAIPAAALEAAADPDDRNGDGISGRVQRVWDPTTSATVLGRFGWKANQATVADQTTAALNGDLGVTEMDAGQLADMIFYNRTIAVPIAKDVAAPMTRRGAAVFQNIGCAACHTPTQHAGPSDLPAIAEQTFHPYTDLLLHDMGPGLADGRPEFEASGREWRTAPLWGLGRRIEVTGSGSMLHDGRARTTTEAVLWHGGEATTTRRAFERLTDQDRVALLAFLDTL